MELGIVHRDVSPQNIICGADGVSRVLDFGIAKAAGRVHSTRDGEIKGKFAYMPPEQLHGEHLDRRADIYAAGVVLWEALTGERLFLGSAQTPNLQRLLDADVEPPSSRIADLPASFDAVALKALAREPDDRYPTARAMAQALEACGPAATATEVSAWVESLSGESLARRARLIATLEGLSESAGCPVPGDEETLTIPIPLPFLPVPDDDDLPPQRPPSVTIPLVTIAISEKVARVVMPEALDASEKNEKTEITASRATGSPIRRTAPRRPALVGAAIAALGVSVVAAIWTSARSLPAIPEATDPPPMPSAASASEAPTPSAAFATGSAAPALLAAPREVMSAAPAASPARSAKAPRSTARPVNANPCSPPYFLDAQGHKHYKRECL